MAGARRACLRIRGDFRLHFFSPDLGCREIFDTKARLGKKMDRRSFLGGLAAGAFFSSLPGRIANAATADNLAELDMIATAALIERKEVKASEVALAAMRRIDTLNPRLNALVTKSYKQAMRRAVLGQTGPLAGVPYALKDLNWQEGVRFTQGSHFFADGEGGPVTPYTQKIFDSGVLIMGQTNTPEFGFLPTTESALLGPAHNPWNPDYSTAGSSGGAGAAVASRMLPAAQASDGGGSIRLPAAVNGVFGLKPSRGRFPNQGGDMSGWDLAVRHAVSMTVRDNAFLLALTEADEGALEPVGFVDAPARRRLKFAVSLRSGDVVADAEVQRAVRRVAKRLDDAGHRVEEVRKSPMDSPEFFDNFIVIWASNATGIVQLVEQQTGQRAEDTGLLEPWTIGLARYFGSLDSDRLEVAQAHFRRLTNETARFLRRWDGWISPVTGHVTPKLGYFDPFVPYDTLLERATPFAAFTPIHNVAGTPALSVPAGFDARGLPIGVQIGAALGEERRLLEVAYELEELMPWRDKKPPIAV